MHVQNLHMYCVRGGNLSAMPRVELLFGREHLHGKSVAEPELCNDGNKLACQESQLEKVL